MPALRSKLEPLILASASPRRAELLTHAGIAFEVIVSPAAEPEHKPAGIPTELWPSCLAYMKATAVQKHVSGRSPPGNDRIILAADTIVVHDGRILNKARNRAHARRMLASLSGETHQVITGLCLLLGRRVRLTRVIATCRFQELSPARLAEYLDSGLWRGKAGAYGIQDDVSQPFVRLLDGELTTVIGLPMPTLLAELSTFGALP